MMFGNEQHREEDITRIDITRANIISVIFLFRMYS